MGYAIARQLGRDDVAVGQRFVWFGRERVDLPVEASARIRTFDRTGRMSPFSFTLETP